MDLLRNGRPRVVITGIGVVSALGDAESLWKNLIAGQSGVRNIETLDVSYVPVKIAGEVRDFDPTEYMSRKEARRMGRASHFGIAATTMALEDAGLSHEQVDLEGDRVAVSLGTTLGSHEMGEQGTTKYKTDGFKRPNPLSLLNALPNMPAHYISRTFNARATLRTVSTACASGTQSIGEAGDLIRNCRADIVIAGGVEAILQDYTLAGFESMKALTNEYNDNPTAASRPFDANRSGFVLSEGCAIVIVESLAHALQRDARIYSEILGHGASSDAFHVAALDPDGKGAARAMDWALQDAHVAPEDIDYINAHGTSTQANDAAETTAIKDVFGDHAYKVAISSTKSMLGHAMAGSGALEVVACSRVLTDKVVPPTINYDTPDPVCDLDYVPNEARDLPHVKYTMSNSFGLGGQNASIILGAI